MADFEVQAVQCGAHRAAGSGTSCSLGRIPFDHLGPGQISSRASLMLPLLGHFSRRTFIARDDENHAIKDDSLSAGSYRIKCSLLAELNSEGLQ